MVVGYRLLLSIGVMFLMLNTGKLSSIYSLRELLALDLCKGCDDKQIITDHDRIKIRLHSLVLFGVIHSSDYLLMICVYSHKVYTHLYT